jgi:hypothetical protein
MVGVGRTLVMLLVTLLARMGGAAARPGIHVISPLDYCNHANPYLNIGTVAQLLISMLILSLGDGTPRLEHQFWCV